uniref:Uncharacterized protein n=1 Tax=Arundo donax TaxID=35708 RepID=A0A0A9E2Z2_ARUDO
MTRLDAQHSVFPPTPWLRSAEASPHCPHKRAARRTEPSRVCTHPPVALVAIRMCLPTAGHTPCLA